MMGICDCLWCWCTTPQRMTQSLIIGTAIVWIIYDLWVMSRWGPSATISDVLRAWGYDAPWTLVAFGALLWHFWGTVPKNR